MEILKERSKTREKVIEEARKWAESLPFKASVILIGSYARGDFNLWSDIDIVLIAEFKDNPIERLKKIEYPPGYEVIPLTINEFKKLAEKENPIAIEVLDNGIVLRDDYGIKNLVQVFKPSRYSSY